MPADHIPQAILWHEGMLLAPQHFQQLALRHEALIQYNTLMVAPFAWGIRRLSLDHNLLLGGMLRVLDLEAVMPDGLVVTHNAQGGEDLQIDLTAKKEEMNQRGLPVHLALPASNTGQCKGDLARYRSFEGDAVADQNTGEGELSIARLKPRLMLLAGETPPSKYVSFPLAKVAYQNEAFTLTGFIPPLVTVALQSQLGGLCSLTAKRLREKAMFLADQLQEPSSTIGMPSVLENKSRIQSLTAGLPLFEAVLSAGPSHPYLLYLAFCSLVGPLAALGKSLIPPMFKPYDHNDLRSTFEQLQKFAFQMIEEGISEVYSGIPFHFEGGVFSLAFDPAWMKRRLLLALRGQRGMGEKDLMAWGETCLIGSQSIMQSLHERRILGTVRQFIDRDEELAVSRGVILFTLKDAPEFIKPGELLQILNITDPKRAFRPEEIVLYVRNL